MDNQFVEADPRLHALRSAVGRVMVIERVEPAPGEAATVAFGGRLTIPADQVYEALAPAFQQQGMTLLLRRDKGLDLAIGVPRLAVPGRPNPLVNLVLFALTLITVGYAGLVNGANYLRPEATSLAELRLTAPDAIFLGVAFTASFLGILLAHEFGHYLAARHHGTAVSLPYFIPLPGSPLGTLGAAIRLLEPPRNRRVLLDIGMAGPLAGLAFAVPLLLLGLSLSRVVSLPASPLGFANITLEGNSVAYLAAKWLVTGEWLPAPASFAGASPLAYWVRYFFLGVPAPIGGRDVLLHPVAWAGWTGLLITALNLIPAGQLDGGHAMYVLAGRRAGALLPILIGTMLLLGSVWNGWWIWAALVFFLGRTYAQPLDDITPVGAARRWVALSGVILFLLLFVPVPFRQFGL